MNWPTQDDVIQVLVDELIGEGKRIEDLQNQWFSKHLIIALATAIFMLITVVKFVYENLTTVNAKGEKLDERGFEYGVERKKETYAIHTVTLWKSSPVDKDTQVPDEFLVTTEPVNDNPPIQFRVIADQDKYIAVGQNSVSGVKVICTEPGEIGNVGPGEIKLIAQAGFDYVTDSQILESGTDREDDAPYRQRILDKKRNPERGGVEIDYKVWAESVDGVKAALVLPLARGNGTVDIVISGNEGIAGPDLVARCQAFIDTKTPADIADGGVRVIAPTPIVINLVLSGCIWRQGYDNTIGGPFVRQTLQDYIHQKVNTDRIFRIYDVIALAKQTYDPADVNKNPILLDFVLEEPSANISLNGADVSVPGTITLI